MASISSSIHSCTSSFSSGGSDAPLAASTTPSASRSRLTRARHAFHSSTRRFLWATSSLLALLSSAASSSSNVRLYSLRFRRVAFCVSFGSKVRGRGRQMNCLNLSMICFSCSIPRKSQTAYPFSIYNGAKVYSAGLFIGGKIRQLTECRHTLALVATNRPLGSHSRSVIP
jgi:hypothetical protein